MADKGLKSNVVGLFGGTMLGISSVAPAYALTVTLGILAVSVGAKTPVVIIAGFLPMFCLRCTTLGRMPRRSGPTSGVRRWHLPSRRTRRWPSTNTCSSDDVAEAKRQPATGRTATERHLVQ